MIIFYHKTDLQVLIMALFVMLKQKLRSKAFNPVQIPDVSRGLLTVRRRISMHTTNVDSMFNYVSPLLL